MSGGPPKVALDIHALTEPQRIALVATTCLNNPGKVAGVIVEGDATADRYVQILTSRYPLRILSRVAGPTVGCVVLRVVAAESS